MFSEGDISQMTNFRISRIVFPIVLLCLAISSFSQLIQVPGMSITASSELKSTNHAYSADKAIDGNPATAWVEGAPGNGDSQWVEITFPTPTVFEGIAITPGYRKSAKSLSENVTPSLVKISLDGKVTGYFNLPIMVRDTYNCAPSTKPQNLTSYNLMIFESPRSAKSMKLQFSDARPGFKFADLAISEITPILSNTPTSPTLNSSISALKSFRKTTLQPTQAFSYRSALQQAIHLPKGKSELSFLDSSRHQLSIDNKALEIQYSKWKSNLQYNEYKSLVYEGLINAFVYVSDDKIIGQAFQTAEVENSEIHEMVGTLASFPILSSGKDGAISASISQLRIANTEGECLELPQ